MILIAGGTGTLGRRLVERLRAQQIEVRVLTRHPERARDLEDKHVELVRGDLRDPIAVDRAMAGIKTVVSAAQGGFAATDGATPQSVDGQGNSNLIAAARSHGIEHFVLVSIIDAAPDHPLELWRMKYQAEQELKASGLGWTIIAAAAFMEWALAQYGDPLLKTGHTGIYGRGEMPINLVSAVDVARLVELAITDKAMRGMRVKIAGPENLTLNQVVQAVQSVTVKTGSVGHVPLIAMRLMAVLLAPIKPALAREIKAGIFFDTVDRHIEASPSRDAYASAPANG